MILDILAFALTVYCIVVWVISLEILMTRREEITRSLLMQILLFVISPVLVIYLVIEELRD